MRKLLTFSMVLAVSGSTWASVSVDCNVSISVSNRISSLDIDQQVGAERIECLRDGPGALAGARVVRMVKTNVSTHAEADARSRGSAYAHYSDSCSCSCGECSSQTCHTSGSGSDSCYGSASDSASKSDRAETKFAVARSSLEGLSKRGFNLREGSSGSCEIIAPSGSALDPLKAIAVVTWIYGEELVKENGGDPDALHRFSKNRPFPSPARGRGQGEGVGIIR